MEHFWKCSQKKREKKGKKGEKKGKKRKMFSLCSHENVLLVQHFGVTKKREKNQMFSAIFGLDRLISGPRIGNFDPGLSTFHMTHGEWKIAPKLKLYDL